MADPPIIATRAAQMFPVLTEAEIARLRRFGESRRYADGEALAKVGAPGHGIEILLSGQVEVSKPRAGLALPRSLIRDRHSRVMTTRRDTGERCQLVLWLNKEDVSNG